MAKETEVVPVEQKSVDFYGDELTAVRAEDGQVYVSIRHMCAALGIDRRGQMRRIRDNEVLAEGYKRGGTYLPSFSRRTRRRPVASVIVAG